MKSAHLEEICSHSRQSSDGGVLSRVQFSEAMFKVFEEQTTVSEFP